MYYTHDDNSVEPSGTTLGVWSNMGGYLVFDWEAVVRVHPLQFKTKPVHQPDL